MHHRQARRVSALVAAAALTWTLESGAASAAGLPSVALDQTGNRQGGSSTAPGSSVWPPGPVDIGLAEVGFGDLPVAVEAGQSFTVQVQAPGGAACSGRIAYPNGQWQSLDEAGARVGGCTWEVTVPVGTRPGSLVLAADIGRSGQGRTVFGVVYVSTRMVGDAGGDDRARTTLARGA